MSDFCAFNRGAITKVTVEVSAEDSMGDIAEKLEDAGLIRYKWFFRLFAALYNADEQVGMGTYELNTDMDYRALIMAMQSSSGNMNADTVRVTIPEGYTVSQTIALLAKNGVNTEEALLEAAKTADFDYEFIDNSSEEISRLEGYLFPDTYEFYVGHDPEGALGKLLSNFERKMNEDRLAQVEASGYSLEEIITIASLIEKETDGTDQSMIASVIYNRLASKELPYLQLDSTVYYAADLMGESFDTNLDNPYNTYRYEGLPPGPIDNPGMNSIRAALAPNEPDYYYFA